MIHYKKNLINFHTSREVAYPASLEDAVDVQTLLRNRLKFSPEDCICQENIRLIGGLDVGYDTNHTMAHAVCVVMDIHTLEILEIKESFQPVSFPYITGFLSFREIPTILETLRQLTCWPDIFMVDGHGIAHPRQMGIASHLGALIDYPCFGVAKNRLTGFFDAVGQNKGDYSALMIKNHYHAYQQAGFVLRTRVNVKPIFLSLGHRVTLPLVLNITQRCLRGYKLPEPTRIADKLSKIKSNTTTN